MIEDPETSSESAEPIPHRKHAPAGLAAVAIVVAIVALALAAWSTWQLTRARHGDAEVRKQTATQIADLQAQLAAGGKQAQAGSQRVDTLDSEFDDLRSTVKGLGLRTTNLETAVASLNGRQQSAHDSLLLDDAELLLRTGQQRFELFHDATGALKAYDQAIAVLGQVQDPAYAPVRVSATTERDALAAAAPPSRQADLDELSALRAKVVGLPLASANHSAPSSAAPARRGFWSRIAHSFSGIVRVSRDESGTTAPPPDAAFARQALALDLAQAQESLLAFDGATAHRALQRADELLSGQFDNDDAGVKAARARIAAMLAQPVSAKAPELGGALAQLRSLRASQAPAVPASAASTGGTQP